VRVGEESGAIEESGDESGLGASQGVVEEREALFGGEREESCAPHASEIGITEVSGHGGGVGPGAPGEGGGWETDGAAMVCEGIEESIGGGVVGLTRAPEDAREGGEEDEGGEILVLGELVEVPGGIDLGSQDTVDAFGG
jgi:hypothetical protein